MADFVFVDINCSFMHSVQNGEFKPFNSEEEMMNLVGCDYVRLKFQGFKRHVTYDIRLPLLTVDG